jgi:hypothetical protein
MLDAANLAPNYRQMLLVLFIWLVTYVSVLNSLWDEMDCSM